MIVKMSSVFDCDKGTLFAEVMKSKSFFYVSYPVVKFVPEKRYPIPKKWENGKYLVKMKMFGMIPFPKQWIVMSVYEEDYRLCDNGYSTVIKKWGHSISLADTEDGRVSYSDTIEIDAGVLTPFIFLYAKAFFKHRHRRWRNLVETGFHY